MKRAICVIGCIISSLICNAQSQKISKDSINKLISESFIISNKGEYTKAYKQLIFALEYGKNNASDSIVGEAYNCIGNIFFAIGDFEKAEKNYLLSKEALLQAGYQSYLIYHYNNVAELYYAKKEYKKAEKNFFKSRDLALKLTDEYKALWPTYNIALIKCSIKDFDEAFFYLKEAIRLYQPNTEQQPDIIVNSYILLATIYSDKREYESALESLKDAEAIALKHKVYKELIKIEKHRTVLYDSLNEPKRAIEAMTNQITYLEKNFENQQSLLKEQNKLERDLFEKESSLVLTTELNKSQRESLKKIKLFTLALLTLFAITISVVVLLYRSNKKRLRLNTSLQTKNKELLDTKEKTEYASQLKNNFFSTISHELRTPLYAVTGITDILINENPKEEQVGYLNALKSSGEHLFSLINNILQINKYDANVIELNVIEFNIEEVIEGIQKTLEYLQKENNNQIHIEIDHRVPRKLKGDSVKISQIIINLVSNALKFTLNGNVWLNVKCTDCESKEKGYVILHISVKDDGVGISKQMQSHIFEDFYQESIQLNRNYEGAGLGLAIVKRLLQAMGSKIAVKSKPNEGADFSFSLSLEYEEKSEYVQTKEIDRMYTDLKNKTILVVDDNDINQMITRRILEAKKANVVVIDNGFDAIEIVEKRDFDIILMDIHMPKMNGYEATKKIRSFNKKVPIIALTAIDPNENNEKITSSGMNGVISKPFQLDHFYLELYKFV
ncbi:tetratricopeptide repeat-containing hybrid sensor histidine kinase/response regulator [Aquimarina aquimarini]|uniref:tetratricopeptide repeat-containing hybrid sensor histidine kinase/response regulator n=2 Tax=Aquimarina aquimarini TaxID=1191734 RepID=UPI001F1A104A|nr:response regulator [Aquimarina aquimarini]